MTATEPNPLLALSTELSAAIARVAPSLVYVDGSARRDATGIVWNARTIVTVDHCLERDDEIELVLEGGRRVEATLAGRDPSTDLAILRAAVDLPAAPQSSSAGLAVGNIVLAAGRDEDGRLGASFGVLSALDGAWRTWRGGEIDRLMRPDLTLYPGFSGGPLLDTTGAVLGLNTWGLSRRTALTIPLATIERVVAQLESRGSIARGYLGVALQEVRLPDALRAALGVSRRHAAIVVDVAPGGPAEAAGLTLGDVLLSLAGVPIEGAEDVQRALGSDSIGARRTLEILRGGTVLHLEATVGERPHDE
jgi:S1-C subfamily serine protease